MVTMVMNENNTNVEFPVGIPGLELSQLFYQTISSLKPYFFSSDVCGPSAHVYRLIHLSVVDDQSLHSFTSSPVFELPFHLPDVCLR